MRQRIHLVGRLTYRLLLGNANWSDNRVDLYIRRRAILLGIYRHFSNLFGNCCILGSILFFAGGFAGVSFDTILGSAHPSMDLSGLTDIGNGALVNWAGIMALAYGGYRSIRLYGKGVLSWGR